MEANKDVLSKKSDPLSGGQLKLLPAQPEDAEAFQRCVMRANANNVAPSFVWPKSKAHLTSPEDVLEHRTARLKKGMEQEDALHFKIIDKTDPDRIIAAANFYKPGHFQADTSIMQQFEPAANGGTTNGEQQQKTTYTQLVDEMPAALDYEAYQQIGQEQDKKRKEIWGDDCTFWYCGGLSVDPDYQRRGLATALMKVCMDGADADGVPVYLESTPEGALLYPRIGFRKVGEHSFFGGEFTMEYFIRPVGGV